VPPIARDSIGAPGEPEEPGKGEKEAQAASVPRIHREATTAKRDLMGWIIFEALLALSVMLAAAWWTFRGRRDPGEDAPDSVLPAPAATDTPADRG
jgi:hypothetical protein